MEPHAWLMHVSSAGKAVRSVASRLFEYLAIFTIYVAEKVFFFVGLVRSKVSDLMEKPLDAVETENWSYNIIVFLQDVDYSLNLLCFNVSNLIFIALNAVKYHTLDYMDRVLGGLERIDWPYYMLDFVKKFVSFMALLYLKVVCLVGRVNWSYHILVFRGKIDHIIALLYTMVLNFMGKIFNTVKYRTLVLMKKALDAVVRIDWSYHLLNFMGKVYYYWGLLFIKALGFMEKALNAVKRMNWSYNKLGFIEKVDYFMTLLYTSALTFMGKTLNAVKSIDWYHVSYYMGKVYYYVDLLFIKAIDLIKEELDAVEGVNWSDMVFHLLRLFLHLETFVVLYLWFGLGFNMVSVMLGCKLADDLLIYCYYHVDSEEDCNVTGEVDASNYDETEGIDFGGSEPETSIERDASKERDKELTEGDDDCVEEMTHDDASEKVDYFMIRLYTTALNSMGKTLNAVVYQVSYYKGKVYNYVDLLFIKALDLIKEELDAVEGVNCSDMVFHLLRLFLHLETCVVLYLWFGLGFILVSVILGCKLVDDLLIYCYYYVESEEDCDVTGEVDASNYDETERVDFGGSQPETSIGRDASKEPDEELIEGDDDCVEEMTHDYIGSSEDTGEVDASNCDETGVDFGGSEPETSIERDASKEPGKEFIEGDDDCVEEMTQDDASEAVDGGCRAESEAGRLSIAAEENDKDSDTSDADSYGLTLQNYTYNSETSTVLGSGFKTLLDLLPESEALLFAAEDNDGNSLHHYIASLNNDREELTKGELDGRCQVESEAGRLLIAAEDNDSNSLGNYDASLNDSNDSGTSDADSYGLIIDNYTDNSETSTVLSSEFKTLLDLLPESEPLLFAAEDNDGNSLDRYNASLKIDDDSDKSVADSYGLIIDNYIDNSDAAAKVGSEYQTPRDLLPGSESIDQLPSAAKSSSPKRHRDCLIGSVASSDRDAAEKSDWILVDNDDDERDDEAASFGRH